VKRLGFIVFFVGALISFAGEGANPPGHLPSAATVAAREAMQRMDFSLAAERLVAGVAARDPDALMLQGVLHALGAGTYYDHTLATDYWRQAANAGQREAVRLLLPWLNDSHAREWWQERAKTFPAPAVTVPENLVRTERGRVFTEKEVAKKWIIRESERGNAVGLYNAYEAAQFGARNSEQAKARVRKLLERAAELRLPVAMRELSSEFEQSLPVAPVINLGFPKDLVAAAKWMREAAEMGDGRAELLWGHWLSSGRAGQKDLAAAVDFYRRASAQGIDHATYFLYSAYTSGEGVEKDEQKAGDYLRLAAEQGNDLAVGNYAYQLFYGRGMPADPAAAIAMLEPMLACSLVPNSGSIDLVAFAYATGKGVEKNIAKAQWWGRWAIERGSKYAPGLMASLTAEMQEPSEKKQADSTESK